MEDVKNLAEIEAASYPPLEGASEDSIRARMNAFSNHLWILENDNAKILAFINGFVTDEKDLTDEMYDNPSMHNENGAWQMIFSVVTAPDERKHGYASLVMKKVIEDAKEQGRKGIVLTCKDKLLGFYSTFGFVSEGVSESTHRNVKWNQMRLTF